MGAPTYWPLFGLRLHAGDLELRPMTEADQPAIADLLPADVELDPQAHRFGRADERADRGTLMLQQYWRYYGSWTTQSWRLNFVVRLGERIVGVQELEGQDFPVARTVDTSSFLVEAARGQGLGKTMRSAVLALAFGPLAAEFAITSAWSDNHASLGVSRSLGYLPNGETRERRGAGADEMVHLRLPRAVWLARDRPACEISGFEPCRFVFGL